MLGSPAEITSPAWPQPRPHATVTRTLPRESSSAHRVVTAIGVGALQYQASRLRCRVRIPQVQHHTPPVSSASHESGPHGWNVNLDIPDAGVRVVVLRPAAKDDHCLARFHDRKTFPDSSQDRPLSNRPSRGGMVREMGRRPRPS
jgi:hypothetical protein